MSKPLSTTTPTASAPAVPERLFAVIGENGAVWATFPTEEAATRYPGPRMFELAPRYVVEYRRVTDDDV